MFTRLLTYRLSIVVDGERMPRRELAGHLGRDGERIVRLANGRGVGEANVEILSRSLPHMARFICALRPRQQIVGLRLVTRRIEGGEPMLVRVEQRCVKQGTLFEPIAAWPLQKRKL